MKWIKVLLKKGKQEDCPKTVSLYTGKVGYQKFQHNLPFEGWSSELAVDSDLVVEVPQKAIRNVSSREFNYKFGVVFKVQI